MAETQDFAVIGLGRFGASVARTLAGLGHSVLGVDSNPERVQELADEITHVVQADCTDEHAVRSLGLRNFDTVVVAIGQDLEASILITLMLKEMGVPRVVAKAASELHGKVLERVGADQVVLPEKDMGAKVARALSQGGMLDFLELTPDVSVVELTAGEGAAGRTLKQLDLRARYHVSVIAIRRGREVLVAPLADVPLRKDDVLVAIGKNEHIDRLLREFCNRRR